MLKNLLRTLAAGLLGLLSSYSLSAQTDSLVVEHVQDTAVIMFPMSDSVRVYFPQGKSQFQAGYRQNAKRIEEDLNRVMEASEKGYLDLYNVRVFSSSSPEGSLPLNTKLSENRANSIVNYMRRHYKFNHNLINVIPGVMDWELFRQYVEADSQVPERDSLLRAIGTRNWDNLNAFKGTPTWDYCLKNIYPSLRFSFVVFDYTITIEVDQEMDLDQYINTDIPEGRLDDSFSVARVTPRVTNKPVVVIPVAPVTDRPGDGLTRDSLSAIRSTNFLARLENANDYDLIPMIDRATGDEVLIQRPKKQFHLKIFNFEKFYDVSNHKYKEAYLKTNLATWPLLLPSLGYEAVFAEHWSLGVMGYYSALDWFQPTIKFRVLGLQPEIRYWFWDRLFIGSHLTFGWYNIATNGEYRYQDYKRGTPAYGIGVHTGLKTPLFSIPDTPWGMEITIGAGVMPLHYDIYYNVPNGRWAGEETKTYVGIDHASITLTYRIGRKPLKWGKKK